MERPGTLRDVFLLGGKGARDLMTRLAAIFVAFDFVTLRVAGFLVAVTRITEDFFAGFLVASCLLAVGLRLTAVFELATALVTFVNFFAPVVRDFDAAGRATFFKATRDSPRLDDSFILSTFFKEAPQSLR